MIINFIAFLAYINIGGNKNHITSLSKFTAFSLQVWIIGCVLALLTQLVFLLLLTLQPLMIFLTLSHHLIPAACLICMFI